jgi:hypothetical protein
MKTPGCHREDPLGFALVVTLTLMILLTIIAVSLLGLSAISLRSSSQDSARAHAEANARLALGIALGELQQAIGPDTRISARAATLARHPRLEASVPPASARAWWVGVAHSDPTRGIGPDGRAVVWLVSGLDHAASPAAQITAAQPFRLPVAMFGRNSIDTALLTGGQPLEAGKVLVRDEQGRETGAYAYFIDDNGMKAQLAATHPAVRNDRAEPYGGGVLPGTYELGVLNKMENLLGTPKEIYGRLGSINDLPLIGAVTEIVPAKRLGYTTRSRGVLADVRKGGLKRDLTIAFENDATFDAVFSNNSTGSGFGSRYLVLEQDKYDQASDLQQNGYIHWRMFKDYYNIKKHIRRVSGVDLLDPVQFAKDGLGTGGGGSPFGRGQLGPHAIGANPSTPASHQRMPYGDYAVMDQTFGKNAGFYKHSPITPVLQRMQQNAWVEFRQPASSREAAKLRTKVQLWTSHYNPYNIAIRSIGNAASTGPRVIAFPQARFTIPGLQYRNPSGQLLEFRNISGLAGKRQSHINHEVVLGPGRSHVFAFRNDTLLGNEIDNRIFDDKVRDLTLESVYQDYELPNPPRGRVNLDVDFYLPDPSVCHGTDMNPPASTGDHEISQAFWAALAWNAIDSNLPGKTISKSANSSELNENTMASHSFHLRTTRERDNSIRPLVDANIRAIFHNPKWDAQLGLPTVASYSAQHNGEAPEAFFPMDTRDNPLGYSYWGAGQDPVDGHDRVILFDIPRVDLVSLGQLQHAGVSRFSYEPSYVAGNSYANPRIPLSDWRASARDTFSTAARGLANFAIGGNFNLYDASYLVNEALWDSYIFTTIPQVADNYGSAREPTPNDAHFRALLAGDSLLPNPRFIPYEPPGSKFDSATLRMPSGTRGISGGFYHNAGHLLVDGAFNVNSTSVDAWEAFLSGTHELPYRVLNPNGQIGGFSAGKGVRFPRVQSVLGGPMTTAALDQNFWTGFRTLEPLEVRTLAEAIVEEITKRGPFLTLAQFVNRKLESGDPGQSGTLQAALDATVNQGLDHRFSQLATHPRMPKDATQGTGFPGQLLQGDVLQALSPYMTVRSDSFTIRTYGESRDSAGNVRARAWCEATVQRYPDPVALAGSTSSALAQLINPPSPHGRCLRVLSFRWLNDREI